MLDMLFEGIRIDENIVEECDTEFVEIFAEHEVDISLKRCRGVGESKWHDEIFKVTIACSECCFPLFAQGDSNEVVCGTQVDFGITHG